MSVKIRLKTKNSLPGAQHLSDGGFPKYRFGFWGMVTELHPEDNTVHVRMDTGRELIGVRVASLEWVTIPTKENGDKGFLSGERNLPPVDTFVFCVMPTGEPTSAFVLCSGFGRNIAQHAAFKEDSEDAKHIGKRVDNSGWVYTTDNRTGTKTIQNREEDETIKIEIDQEDKGKEKVKITVHENIIKIDPETGVSVESDKNYSGKYKGKTDIVADDAMSFKCSKTGLLELGNTVATLGAMISDLLQAGISFKSVGSPATHTAPDFSAKCGEIKAKWDQVFK
jgi:hypothetical protein